MAGGGGFAQQWRNRRGVPDALRDARAASSNRLQHVDDSHVHWQLHRSPPGNFLLNFLLADALEVLVRNARIYKTTWEAGTRGGD